MSLLVVGMGNEFRSDDAVGLVVARRISARRLPEVVVLEESGEGVALMERWKGARQAILVDAVSSGAKPGTIHRFDAHLRSIPAKFFHSSTHSFGLAEAVELARALGELPPRLVVYGIEASRFTAGVALTD